MYGLPTPLLMIHGHEPCHVDLHVSLTGIMQVRSPSARIILGFRHVPTGVTSTGTAPSTITGGYSNLPLMEQWNSGEGLMSPIILQAQHAG